MSSSAKDEHPWTWVAAMLAMSHRLGTACALFGIIALAGYFGSVEELYRPIANGPATHPLTALCILILGLGVRVGKPTANGIRMERFLALLAAGILFFRLEESVLGSGITAWITPFQAKVLLDQQAGGANTMGINTAVMLMLIAVSLVVHSFQMPKLSQITASVAIAIPTISFTGYAYELERFYGQMSLLTATAGFGLACACLSLTANHGGLRAILSPYIGGKIARAQAFAGYLLPTGLGYILVKSFATGSKQSYSLFGFYVVAVCWFIILMVGVSAYFHEQVDFARRQGEAKLAAAALTDALTGLPNRRKFFEYGKHEIERMKRNNSELWVLMIDLDHFKRINDTGGHAIGDRVLVAVANVLASSVRKVDLVGRIGGEEFAVLLTDTNQGGCERVAEHIRNSIESLEIADWTHTNGRITTSIGCAKPGPTETLEAALNAADEALYSAKGRGRNCVAFSQRSDPPSPDQSSAHTRA